MGTWEQHARRAYELFEKDGNRVIMIEELASVYTFLPLFLKLYLSSVILDVCFVDRSSVLDHQYQFMLCFRIG